MPLIHQLNFGASDSNMDDGLPHAICNCLVIEASHDLILIDTGLGVLENDTLENLSRNIPDMYSITIDPNLPALRQLSKWGYDCRRVKHIILTHLDVDHAGGLRDFPNAEVHLSIEEHAERLSPRYSQTQFEHNPKWLPHPPSRDSWFGMEARSLAITDDVDLRLIPLPGHTAGHCGVAVRARGTGNRWILHVGDTYYSREELYGEVGLLSVLSRISSTDNRRRMASLAEIRRLLLRHADEIDVISSHDPTEEVDLCGA